MKHDRCVDKKSTDGFPKNQTQTASRRGSRRGSRGEVETYSRGKEHERNGKNGGEATLHKPKTSIGDKAQAGGDGIPESDAHELLDGAEAPSITEMDSLDLNEFYLGGAPQDDNSKRETHNEIDGAAEAPSTAELDELDLNEFYLGGAPHALRGLANGLQILEGIVTGHSVAQEFSLTRGSGGSFHGGLSPAAVSLDGTDYDDANCCQTYSPDLESDEESFESPVPACEENKVDQLQMSFFPAWCLPCVES